MDLGVSIFKIFFIVQIPGIHSHAVIIAQIFCFTKLFGRHQCLAHLLSVADTDIFHVCFRSEQITDRSCKVSDGSGRRLLDKEVTRAGVFKCEQDQIDRFIQSHQEPGHVRIGNGDILPTLNLVNKQRDHRPAAAHHVSVSGDTNGGLILRKRSCLRNDHFLHHRFGDTHRIDRIGRLIGRKADDLFDTCCYGCLQHIVRAQDICFHCFQREELTAWHLL